MNPTQKPYEPPISTHPFPQRVWHPTTKLAQGVYGFTFEDHGFIFIPLIVAEREGSGDVGRFLDSLSERCVIVNVTSNRLRAMLMRRKWTKIQSGDVDSWTRMKMPE